MEAGYKFVEFVLRIISSKDLRERLAFWLAKRGRCLSLTDFFIPEIKDKVLEMYEAVRPFVLAENLCRYVAMYIYLTYARLIGGIECEAALEYVREALPEYCADGKGGEECIIAEYLLTNKATKKMRLLAKRSNIYGKIAKFVRGGKFPSECLEDLRKLIEKMPKTHRKLLNIPPIREEAEKPQGQPAQLAEASHAKKGSYDALA